MKERIEVYESLRSEIVTMEELQRNVWIYMYVLFCTLFVLGLQWSNNLFLVTYIILIPFQCVINEYKWSIAKLSTYIRIFFENENKKISWESLHTSNFYKKYYSEKQKKMNTFIGMTGAIHLGFLSTVFYCVNTLKDSYINDKFLLEIQNIFFMILSILLLAILAFLNRSFYRDYDNELEDIMERYKKERKSNNQ